METSNKDSTSQMLNVLQAKGCWISAADKSASDNTNTTCKAIFELWCALCRTFLCKTRISRSNIQVKYYVAIFICPAVKTLHLELVSNFKSGAFIAAPRIFIARMGNCLNLYSKNGTKFIGAQQELRELRKLFASESHQSKLSEFAQKHLHGVLFVLWTLGGWRALYDISREW